MANSVLSEPNSGAWWNYFFLYDSSKVKEEGDPTRAGICYFYPSQTLLDQQELLCGQIAGVVRCIVEISSVPPSLIRLRKLKFAVRLDGEYLWVLGCAVELPDISCKHFLDHLIGLFQFYNGPVCQAYTAFSQEELSKQWDQYIDHIQKNTSDLHRIFNSLWHLDKTKVDPLLLLKAALILQTCQRCRHVLAGCILYKGLIVSTQLPPPIAAKVLHQGAEPAEKSGHSSGDVLQDHDPPLPPGVCLLPVFLTEEESAALWDFPVEWMTSLPVSPASAKAAPRSRAFSDPMGIKETLASTSVRETAWDPPGAGVAVSIPDSPCPSGFPEPPASTGDAHPGALSNWSPEESSAAGDAAAASPGEQGALPGNSGHSAAEHAQDTDASSALTDSAAPCAQGREDQNMTVLGTTPEAEPCFLQRCHAASSSFATGSTSKELSSSIWSQPHSQGTTSHGRLPGVGVGVPSNEPSLSDPAPNAEGSEQQLPAGDHGGSQGPGTVELYETVVEGASSPGSRATGSADPTRCPAKPAALVKMVLYVHSIRGLVLSLLAEEQLGADTGAIEEVYHSSLASLNGLEVHLKETWPRDPAATKATYSFTHYDCIQNVLAANLPPAAGAQDQHFLRAASLIHADFAQLPAVSEMIVRNACTAVYACRSPVQETYFQQLGVPPRNSGAPNPRDSAFSLPGKAKQKLLKHGVNLL
ncbi:PREDICTED: Hermansky-Pudlak syndrome 4 protein isoform X1 [Crocodylus porosus]|uniref:HPS4 biosis of lysosomal organelles complex 3 subunit 2 n=1 Tax=Crocodylus porosus TaxID=8502 RepID=A0A7M4FXM9_CROPO|nr:PREDICTED: Hermansky-Pudlak syndrome 4 protein isoform X1 [Crocodylus porosus]